MEDSIKQMVILAPQARGRSLIEFLCLQTSRNNAIMASDFLFLKTRQKQRGSESQRTSAGSAVPVSTAAADGTEVQPDNQVSSFTNRSRRGLRRDRHRDSAEPSLSRSSTPPCTRGISVIDRGTKHIKEGRGQICAIRRRSFYSSVPAIFRDWLHP
jgi:hypothetical protein